MKHFIIMPEDCYKTTSGRYEGSVVRKSSMGVEARASFHEVRYIVSDFSQEAIEQAWRLHTCDAVLSEEYGDRFPAIILTGVPPDPLALRCAPAASFVPRSETSGFSMLPALARELYDSAYNISKYFHISCII